MSTYDWSAHVPSEHEIETYTGKYVDLENPQAHQIDLQSIAHGLANTCRYNGQVKFYSVAEHAVMVSRRLERQGFDAETQLAGLHHDDAEAFLGDVTRPLKGLLQPVYGELSDRMDLAVFDALRLPLRCAGNLLHGYEEVKAADNWALFIEADNLLPSKGRYWSGQSHNWEVGEDSDRETDSDLWTGGMDPDEAAGMWLTWHDYLMEQLDDIEDARRAISEYVV